MPIKCGSAVRRWQDLPGASITGRILRCDTWSVKQFLARLDLTAERLAAIEWGRMEPRRRRRWAFVLTLECLVIFVGFGWALSAATDDPTAWVAMGVTCGFFAALFWGLAANPKAAIKVACVAMPVVFVLGPIGFAYLTRNA